MPLLVLLFVMKNAVPPLAHAPLEAIAMSAAASASAVGVATRHRKHNTTGMAQSLNVGILLILGPFLEFLARNWHRARKG